MLINVLFKRYIGYGLSKQKCCTEGKKKYINYMFLFFLFFKEYKYRIFTYQYNSCLYIV